LSLTLNPCLASTDYTQVLVEKSGDIVVIDLKMESGQLQLANVYNDPSK
jgi:hypothetical protein